MRVIDIDYFVTDWAQHHGEYDLYDLEYIYENDFDVLPIIEAEPVKRGHWIKNELDGYDCSVCNAIYYCKDNHCGNCGIEMDEEV